MDQQLPPANIITLGVRDFAREREFYRQLGGPRTRSTATASREGLISSAPP